MNPKDKLSNLLGKNLWEEKSHGSWPISTYTLKRNLKKEPFPHKQAAAKAKQHLDKILEEIKKAPYLGNGYFFDFSELSLIEKEALLHHAFFHEETTEERPHQAVYISPCEKFYLFINLNDHLIIHAIDYTQEGYLLWKQLQEIDDFLLSHLEIAFTPRFGFLTSHIHQCGTGLCIKSYLHLPISLVVESEKAESACDIGVEMFYFPHPPFMCLKNAYSLGYTEEDLLKNMQEQSLHLLEKENALKQALTPDLIEKLKHTVSKGVGALRYGYAFSAAEALEVLSDIKMGLGFGWIEGISHKELNYMIYHCTFPSFDEADQDRMRSQFIQLLSKNLVLKLG